MSHNKEKIKNEDQRWTGKIKGEIFIDLRVKLKRKSNISPKKNQNKNLKSKE